MSHGTPEEVVAAIATAVNAHDLDAFVALHEPDAIVVIPPQGAIIPSNGMNKAQGHDEIRTALKPFFASKPQATIEPHGVVQTDGTSMIHSHFTINLTRPCGEEVVKTGMGTVVSRQQPDDSWLIVFDFPFRA